ncbi:MAG: hypothetical protein JNJ54_11200 [Myxococcaceae bacterium]|nr:hypothetical protein [Myxococcaceae bacterium]
MSRSSRFDKLENERAPREGEERPLVAEERFAEAPGPSTRAVEHAPAMEAALEASPSSPDATAPQLKRFETDGANHLSLDTDELVRLPFRRCPECERDSSKFDHTCIFCHASLETPAARELNLSILASYDSERAKAQQQAVAEHQANIKQLVEDEFKKQLEAQTEAEGKTRRLGRLGLVVIAVGCFVVAVWARSFCVSLTLVTTAVALIVFALPHEARAVLGTHVRWRRF